MKIYVLGSTSFMKEMVDAKKILEKKGHEVLLPEMAESFATGKVSLNDFKDGRTDANFKKKYDLVRKHFEEVARGDVVLVLNYDRDENNKNYIGGNTFAEIAIAFYLKKPIYLLNPMPEYVTYAEEIKSMDPIILNGDLKGIK